MIPAGIILVVSGAVWGYWVSEKPSARWVRFVGPVALCGTVAGIAFTVRALIAAFAATQRGDPSQRAHRLAEEIALAMRGVMGVVALQVVAAIVLLVATWRYHWSVRARGYESGLPYR